MNRTAATRVVRGRKERGTLDGDGVEAEALGTGRRRPETTDAGETSTLHDPVAMGTGWYRQLSVVVTSVVALVALAAGIAGGGAAVLRVGLVVSVLGVLALAVWASPWFERDWPLDGKYGWLTAGSILTPVGLSVALVGLLL